MLCQVIHICIYTFDSYLMYYCKLIGNGGTGSINKTQNVNLNLKDVEGLLKLAEEKNVILNLKLELSIDSFD